MWQNNANDYKARIREQLGLQVNAAFFYFLLQESIRYLEIMQAEYKSTISWFRKDYRQKKLFISRSQEFINSFNALSVEKGRFQLSKLFAFLSSVNNFLRENCTDDGILSFLASSDEARRYNDFSGQVYYAIKSPVVKVCFDLSSEYYKKQIKRLYEQADKLALVPLIQSILGLNNIPTPVKQYKINQRIKVEEMWLDAAYPRRLATPLPSMNSLLNRHNEGSFISSHVSFERCRDLRKQAVGAASEAQKCLSALCKINENSLLHDIENAAKRIKRFTLFKKSGRRSIMTLVQELRLLRQFDHNSFLKIKTSTDLKQILKKTNNIQNNIYHRIQHLKQLPLMKFDLNLLLALEKNFQNFVRYIQQQAHHYSLECQFIEQEKLLPELKVSIEMHESDVATDWKRLCLTLVEIADRYRLPMPALTATGIESLLELIQRNCHFTSEPGCLLDPEKLLSVGDLSLLTYFIFSRRYADQSNDDTGIQHCFILLNFDKKSGLTICSTIQDGRFIHLLNILETLKLTPLLHYSIRLVAVAMMQESRTSIEYATLYMVLDSLLNNSYAAFVSDYHAFPKNIHWALNYLPYAVETRLNSQSTSFVRTRLLGNGYVTSATIFPTPKYAIDESLSRSVSIDLDMFSGSPEVHPRSLSQSSLRNSLVLLSNSPERRKASIDRLEDVCGQLVVHAKTIMSKHQDFGIMANYESNNPVGYNQIRLMHQRAQQHGHDSSLVMIYMLISWYYKQRENKLYTDECVTYQPMLESCFLLRESLITQLSRPQAVDYKIFENFLNLDTKNLASSAKKLHSILLKMIPYEHLGLALSQEDFALIDQAIKFVNQYPSIFVANKEGMIKDAMVDALIEYRDANKPLLLIITLWQAMVRSIEKEKNSSAMSNHSFFIQVGHWQRRARLAIEGGEKKWPNDLNDYLPKMQHFQHIDPTIKGMWLSLQKLSPESPMQSICLEDRDNNFTALSNEHLSQLSEEEAQQELTRYLKFIFASNLHLVQKYLDELLFTWEAHGKITTSVKVVLMLLECYESYYQSNYDIGLDKVHILKARFEKEKYQLTKDDMPVSIQNRSMADGYSKLRMILFSIAIPVTPKKMFFGASARK